MSKNPSEQALALSQIVQTAKDNFLLLSEFWQQTAREQKTKYDAYIAAGFNPQQAMELVCAGIRGQSK